MLHLGMTAEEMLQGFRQGLLGELASARRLSEVAPHLPEPHRSEVSAMIGDTEELGVAMAALDVALLELAKPMLPVRDDLRG
jgi:hypothetical protein